MLVARSWSPPVRSTAVHRSSMSISSSDSASARLLSGERNTSPTPSFSRSFLNASRERSGSADAAAQTRMLDVLPPASSTNRGRMRMSRSSMSSLPPIRRRRPRRRRGPAVIGASCAGPKWSELLQYSWHIVGQNDHQVAIADLLDCTGNGLGLAVYRLDSIRPDPNFRQAFANYPSYLTRCPPTSVLVLLENHVVKAGRPTTHAAQIFVPAIARCGDHADATLGRHAPDQIHEPLDSGGDGAL